MHLDVATSAYIHADIQCSIVGAAYRCRELRHATCAMRDGRELSVTSCRQAAGECSIESVLYRVQQQYAYKGSHHQHCIVMQMIRGK